MRSVLNTFIQVEKMFGKINKIDTDVRLFRIPTEITVTFTAGQRRFANKKTH